MIETFPNRNVQSILDELSYLKLERHDLVIEDNAQLGVGGYGEVFLAKLGGPGKPVDVAVKCVWAVGTMGDRQRFATRFTRELKLWASIRHLNILPLIGFYLSDNGEIAQLVSPFIANGDVKRYLSLPNIKKEKRLEFVCDIAAGVDFLHSHCPPICHGDLKPANVLVTENEDAVLCDFGLASLADTAGASSGLTTSRSIKGTTRYMSPELLFASVGSHTLASDVWAWACTAFEILTDCPPYSETVGEVQILLAIVSEKAPGAIEMLDAGPRDHLASCISACWSFTSDDRPKMRDINKEVFPTWKWSDLSSKVDCIGSVSVQISASLDFDSNPIGMVGPMVWVMLNGVCRGVARCSDIDATDNGAPFKIDVDVRSVREVIVLEVRILGRVEAPVRYLANKSQGSEVWLRRYALQNFDGQINIEYRLKFCSLDIASTTDGSNVYPDSDNFDSQSVVSGATSFYTAPSVISDYEMLIPGGLREIHRLSRTIIPSVLAQVLSDDLE